MTGNAERPCCVISDPVYSTRCQKRFTFLFESNLLRGSGGEAGEVKEGVKKEQGNVVFNMLWALVNFILLVSDSTKTSSRKSYTRNNYRQIYSFLAELTKLLYYTHCYCYYTA